MPPTPATPTTASTAFVFAASLLLPFRAQIVFTIIGAGSFTRCGLDLIVGVLALGLRLVHRAHLV
jgi:hypothetical protein